MPSTVLLSSFLLPHKSVELGRLVLNAKQPQQDFFEPTAVGTDQIAVSVQQNFAEIQLEAKATNLRSILTQLVTTSHGKHGSRAAQLEALRATTYHLVNSGAWFDRLCGMTETRKWLEKAFEQGKNVYLVVGYHTVFDAHFRQQNLGLLRNSARIRGPSEVLVNGGVRGFTPGSAGEVGLGVTRREFYGHQRYFTAPGERIYAVQYRKVKFRWFSSRNVDRAFLEQNNRWKVFWEVRGQVNDEDDVVEAYVYDGIDANDVNDKFYGKLVTEDGEEFLSASNM